jgi:hypothetical protein
MSAFAAPTTRSCREDGVAEFAAQGRSDPATAAVNRRWRLQVALPDEMVTAFEQHVDSITRSSGRRR